MEIENAFSVPVARQRAWDLLTDIEAIVPCMPGAELERAGEDGAYKGKVTTRLGPVTLTFDGTARFTQLDADDYRASLNARGSDTKGRGAVDANITMTLPAGDEQSTDVHVHTNLTLSGAVAQYGRGAGMVTELANHWMAQFAGCLSERLAGQGKETPAGESPPAPAAPVSVLGVAFGRVWRSVLRALRLN